MSFNRYPSIKGFKAILRVHRKTPACNPVLTRMELVFHTSTSSRSGFVDTLLGSHRTVYLAALKHSLNKPHQTESGRGLCGTVTRHMKPPEPQCGFSLLYVHMRVYVCVCLCFSV